MTDCVMVCHLKIRNLVKGISRCPNNGEVTNRDREYAVTQARSALASFFSLQNTGLVMKRGSSNLVPEARPLFH